MIAFAIDVHGIVQLKDALAAVYNSPELSSDVIPVWMVVVVPDLTVFPEPYRGGKIGRSIPVGYRFYINAVPQPIKADGLIWREIIFDSQYGFMWIPVFDDVAGRWLCRPC